MTEDIKKSEPTTPATRPSDPLAAMRAEVERVFDRFTGGQAWPGMPDLWPGGSGQTVAPSVDVRETDKEIIVEAELPGMQQDDVDITLRDGVLLLKGEKKSERTEEKQDYHLTERSYGSFRRSFRVPDTVDEHSIAAHLADGVLRVTLPKKAGAVKPEKKIPIAKTR